MSARQPTRLLAGLGVLAAAIALAALVPGLDVGMLVLSPALLLLVLLLAGRYVGEEHLTRWRVAFTPRRRRGAAILRPHLRRVTRTAAVCTGAQIAAALGRRGPPRAGPLAV